MKPLNVCKCDVTFQQVRKESTLWQCNKTTTKFYIKIQCVRIFTSQKEKGRSVHQVKLFQMHKVKINISIKSLCSFLLDSNITLISFYKDKDKQESNTQLCKGKKSLQ